MQIQDLPYSAQTDFPEIVVDSPNKYYAALLQNLYASCSSETGAILQYVFQSYVVQDKEKEIAKLFKNIAMVEMHHHKHLAEAIIKLGGVPYYTNSQGTNFNIRCVYEGTNLKQMLLSDIENEEKAILEYNYTKTKINNPTIQALIDRIVLDEELHKKSLETVLEYISFYK